jgi:hypothetical protein
LVDGLFKLGKNRFPIGTILLGFIRVETNHVAAIANPDFFDHQVRGNLLIPASAGEDFFLKPKSGSCSLLDS